MIILQIVGQKLNCRIFYSTKRLNFKVNLLKIAFFLIIFIIFCHIRKYTQFYIEICKILQEIKKFINAQNINLKLLLYKRVSPFLIPEN